MHPRVWIPMLCNFSNKTPDTYPHRCSKSPQIWLSSMTEQRDYLRTMKIRRAQTILPQGFRTRRSEGLIAFAAWYIAMGARGGLLVESHPDWSYVVRRLVPEAIHW